MVAPHGLTLISLKDELSVPTPTVNNNREKDKIYEVKENHHSGTERMGNKQK